MYKSAKTVIQMLIDIVSKNGNLLLSIPIGGDGSIDEKELKVLEGITAWMDINSECIYETRPWYIYGEGPRAESANPIKAQGFNEGKGEPYTSKDIRFTTKGDAIYAVLMECPENNEEILVKSLAAGSHYFRKNVNKVEMLGGGIISYKFDTAGLHVRLPVTKNMKAPIVLKVY